jgi:S-adenosylmethionine:tRNA ribosyltransferase-isomerase
MELADFDFDLPPELIAQRPAEKRTDSRLMIVDRQRAEIGHDRFCSIEKHLQPGDLLILNDTRVIPARLFGHKESGGKIEVFLAERQDVAGNVWDCLAKSSRPLRPGVRLIFDEGLIGEVVAGAEAPKQRICFSCAGDVAELLDRIGRLPLPPYIERSDTPADRERYQTVFARKDGALAAPTAGLHFTEDVLNRLQENGVEIGYITLHVGIGTFLPVRVEKVADHRMHDERFHVDCDTAEAINSARREGRRIVAVGTTVARTLESVWDDDLQEIMSGDGRTDIFIYPGYKFNVIDALLTNFHLPRSTLLMLVSAFAGREFIHEAYRQAIFEKYRFYSYGDCMLIQ